MLRLAIGLGLVGAAAAIRTMHSLKKIHDSACPSPLQPIPLRLSA